MKKLIINIISIVRKIIKPWDHLRLLKIMKLTITMHEIMVMSHYNKSHITKTLYVYKK